MIFYFDLTAHEKAELTQLGDKLFQGDKFKTFTVDEENSADYQRYNYLVIKKQRYLKNLEETRP